MQHISKITPCLCFEDQAETAAEFYASVFENSRIITIACYLNPGWKSTADRPDRS
jgi:predicted 3-demethylubiquinone-9 3-methyltransferase (glyoxalase superfamily)